MRHAARDLGASRASVIRLGDAVWHVSPAVGGGGGGGDGRTRIPETGVRRGRAWTGPVAGMGRSASE